MSPINLIMPHYCCSCGEIGAIFCDNCKYNINKHIFNDCVLCNNDPVKMHVQCSPSWCVGRYDGPLKLALERYKFHHARDVAKPLAQLLSARCGQLPPDAIVTSVPTLPSHIRQRGFDHAERLAREFAKRQHLPYKKVFKRKAKTQQRGSSRRQREHNAVAAFEITKQKVEGRYILVDDIATTGATLRQLSGLLRDAGAAHVSCAVIAKQPLD